MYYYAGLNMCPKLFHPYPTPAIDEFAPMIVDDTSSITIGWNYCLLWEGMKVFLSGQIGSSTRCKQILIIPETDESSFRRGIPGKNCVILLSKQHQLWKYHLHKDPIKNYWERIDNFIFPSDDAVAEYPEEIAEHRSLVVLTNLGRVFNAPHVVEMPEGVKFVDIACGFEHTLMRTDNGDVYSMGAGSRGQLGHGDLEDCDEPRRIEALAGLKVAQIAAGGWHNAVITSEGDLYAWGWNTNGELGLAGVEKVVAVPRVVDFKTDSGIDVNVARVECGNTFTVCLLEDKTLWGCGSNKYGQLGQPRTKFPESSQVFVKLELKFCNKIILNIKCQQWGTLIET